MLIHSLPFDSLRSKPIAPINARMTRSGIDAVTLAVLARLSNSTCPMATGGPGGKVTKGKTLVRWIPAGVK